MTAGTLALLLSVWAGLAVKDAAERGEERARDAGIVSEDRAPTVVPQTRTRAS
jgi:hypothetical protein